MKRIRLLLISVLCIVTALACSLTASAQAVEYYLEELGMTISISDSMSVRVKGPDSDLPREKYLEATSADKNLTLTITMVTNENIKKIDLLSDQPSDVISEIKSNFVADGLSEGKDETYGDALFLNFTQEEKRPGVSISARYSVTYINGMSITIVSQSKNGTFSNEDLTLIKDSLESIRFDSIEEAKQENTAKTVKTWIIVIVCILLTAGAAIIIITLLKKKKAQNTFDPHKNRKSDYDVFKSPTPSANPKQIGGYKTSTDYFDNHFDNAPRQKKPSAPQTNLQPAKKTGAATRLGYFAKNLKREFAKPKANPNKAKKSKTKTKSKPKAVDYDIFSGK